MAMSLTELTRRLEKLERKIVVLEGYLEKFQIDLIRGQRLKGGS